MASNANEDGIVGRATEITGGVVLGVMTFVVATGAAAALWLGAPLLNPLNCRFSARDIPTINTDSRIMRPARPSDVSPRAGVVRPVPPVAKPKAITVIHRADSTGGNFIDVASESSSGTRQLKATRERTSAAREHTSAVRESPPVASERSTATHDSAPASRPSSSQEVRVASSSQPTDSRHSVQSAKGQGD